MPGFEDEINTRWENQSTRWNKCILFNELFTIILCTAYNMQPFKHLINIHILHPAYQIQDHELGRERVIRYLYTPYGLLMTYANNLMSDRSGSDRKGYKICLQISLIA